MKVTLDIPDDGRRFTAFYGRELIAFTKEDILYRKTVNCNRCGECCMNEPSTVFGNDDEGKCNKLVKYGDVWECAAGNQVPFDCVQYDPDELYCCIEHTEERLR